MKKIMAALMAATLFSISIAAFAAPHGASHDAGDVQCAKECEMLLKDCAKEVESIQQRIKRLNAAINKEGGDPQRLEELKVMKQKLAETNALLKSLEKPGH